MSMFSYLFSMSVLSLKSSVRRPVIKYLNKHIYFNLMSNVIANENEVALMVITYDMTAKFFCINRLTATIHGSRGPLG